ncbi:MAG: hypothetical protein PHC42_03815, partial [Bacilli bacterium]|nr:hypothetical protein [Bacilli bacterium]
MTEINLKDYEEAGIDYASVSDNLSKVINNINGVIDKLHYKVKNIVTDDVSSIMTKLNIDKSNIDLTSENIALIYIIYLGAINSIEIDFGNLEDIFSNIDLLKLGEKMDPETYIQFLSMLGFSSSRIKELIEENNRILNEFNNNSTSVFIGSDSALQQIYNVNFNALTINLDYDENSNYSVNGNYEGLKRFVNLTQDRIDIIKTSMDEENPDYNLFIEQQRGLGYFYDTFDSKDLTDKEKFELLLSNLENGVSSIENEIQKMRSLELQTVKLQNALYGVNRFEELASFEIEKNSEGFIEFCETNASNGNEEQLSAFLINKVKSFVPDEADQNYLKEHIKKGNYSVVASLLGGYGIGAAKYMYWP